MTTITVAAQKNEIRLVVNNRGVIISEIGDNDAKEVFLHKEDILNMIAALTSINLT